MEFKYEKLGSFFEQIKGLGFWQRLFGWKRLLRLSYEAYEEFKVLIAQFSTFTKEFDQIKSSLAITTSENQNFRSAKIMSDNELANNKHTIETLNKKDSDLSSELARKEEIIKNFEKRHTEIEKEIALVRQKADLQGEQLSKVLKENTIFKQQEEQRNSEYQKQVASLNTIKEDIQKERNKELEEQKHKAIEKIETMKAQWTAHEENVRSIIKLICQRHTIEYVERAPFRGNPDNTIKIADEYIIFDAKSPALDNTDNNFNIYLKNQAESAKKYINQDKVKKDIFLVVPSNTLSGIKTFCYNLADYVVYIISVDALEPILVSLQKIEAYEFADQLEPEERENICRLLGKFAHLTKRRLQIDQFFMWHFLDILTKCKTDLPDDILRKVIEFEKAEKLNPPVEKRDKQILTKELETESVKIKSEVEAKGIATKIINDKIRQLPLYTDDLSRE